MNRSSEYREILRQTKDWEPYLRAESNLPGPRSNLELAQAAADLASREQIEQLLAYNALRAPVNTPDEFLACCGVIALGRLLAEGDESVLPRLKALANDPRWRIRESVAMAFQRLGDASVDHLIQVIEGWAYGSLLEQRALAAALCEPRLLGTPTHAETVLKLLDQITRGLLLVENRKSDEFQALKKGLAYCWSVAMAALPETGKRYFEPWLECQDRDVRWIAKENLKKNRLLKMDRRWVEAKLAGLE